jgi:flavin-dependent dehydrogenase
MKALGRIGLEKRVQEIGRQVLEIQVLAPGRSGVTVPCPLVTVQRRKLDALLVRTAMESGTRFIQGHVTDVTVCDDRKGVVTLGEQELQARVILLATGSDVRLASKLGLIVEKRPHGLAIRCYVTSKSSVDHSLVSYERSAVAGYGWVFPMADGVFNVGCGFSSAVPLAKRPNLRTVFETFTREVSAARDIMKKAEALSSMRGGRLRYGLRGTHAYQKGPVLLLGDVIGATLPASGAGIGQAMRTGEMAAGAVHLSLTQDDPSLLVGYTESITTQMLPQHRRYMAMEKLVTHPWFIELGGQLSQRNKWLRRVTSDIMRDELDPVEYFSPKSILARYRNRRASGPTA